MKDPVTKMSPLDVDHHFLPKDLALLKDPAFKEHVETYAKDQDVTNQTEGLDELVGSFKVEEGC